MENKIILIDTLKLLSKDLQTEMFILFNIRKKMKQIAKEEKISAMRVKEIRARINFNLKKHGQLLKE